MRNGGLKRAATQIAIPGLLSIVIVVLDLCSQLVDYEIGRTVVRNEAHDATQKRIDKSDRPGLEACPGLIS